MKSAFTILTRRGPDEIAHDARRLSSDVLFRWLSPKWIWIRYLVNRLILIFCALAKLGSLRSRCRWLCSDWVTGSSCHRLVGDYKCIACRFDRQSLWSWLANSYNLIYSFDNAEPWSLPDTEYYSLDRTLPYRVSHQLSHRTRSVHRQSPWLLRRHDRLLSSNGNALCLLWCLTIGVAGQVSFGL